MSLEEWESTPPELRRRVKDPFYTEQVEEDHAFIDEEWDGESEEVGYITGDPLSDEAAKEELKQAAALFRVIESREKIMHPERYGLPDFLRRAAPGESAEQLNVWRKAELKRFIEEDMYAVKEGKRIKIRMVTKNVDAIFNVFWGGVNKVIWWKARGGGGSITAAILIWLLMVYKQRACINMAGSSDQASNIYDYVSSFWDCFPALKRDLLEGDPLMTRTQLRTGARLKCITSSDKAGRGKHDSVIIVDEACQDDEQAEKAMKSAVAGVVSEDDSITLMLSTFHHPIGLFQEYWDLAEERGFKKEKWDIFDVMEPCKKGLECATPEDPEALNYCATQCPLSWTKEKRAPDGTLEETQKKGCWGKARHAEGFMSWDKVREAQKTYTGTQTFEIEFACERPTYEGTIYSSEMFDPCKVPPEDLLFGEQYEVSVGIDWGLAGQTAITVQIFNGEYVFVPEAHFMTGKSVDEVITVLLEINETYGEFDIYADISHPFNNLQLEEFGFNVISVAFKIWKEIGISNVVRFLISKKVKINKEMTVLIEQLKQYKRNKQGKPIKKDDHGPDALNIGMLAFIFPEVFPDLMGMAGDKDLLQKIARLRENKGKSEGGGGVVQTF